ncbi:MAG: polyprenyl diphosphate synthase [Methermicoccaceae archaeon]
MKLVSVLRRAYERTLLKEIRKGDIPRHVAIIMDGNRRYAYRTGRPVSEGHRIGSKTTENILHWCCELGIKTVSIYAFSTENLSRKDEEKHHLFSLIEEKLKQLLTDPLTYENELRVSVVGDVNLLPPSLVSVARKVEQATSHYDRVYLNIALAYGGRNDILSAVKSLASDVKNKKLSPDDLTEDEISSRLYANNGLIIPDVDLVIRTGGEYRMSNFLPWQANGNESAAYFCSPYWPEFGKVDFMRAIRTYQQRKLEREKSSLLRLIALAREWGIIELEDIIANHRKLLGKFVTSHISSDASESHVQP